MIDPTDTPDPTPAIPEFSVLISLYDGERVEYFDQCLRSVAEQSWPATEIVIVLDGPVSEALTAVIECWRASLPLEVLALPEHVGLGRALAQGIEACRYELVVRVDTDDVSQPWRFERQVGFLDHNPHLDICGSCMWEIHPESQQPLARKSVPETDTAILAMLPYRNPFNHPTVALRRSRVLAAGNYGDLPSAEDYDLWVRMLAGGCRGWNLQDDLVLARAGPGLAQRRRGWTYARTEYRLYRIKRRHRVGNPLSAALIFAGRALARLLPAFLLRPVYGWLRRYS